MDVTIRGRNLEVTPRLQEYVEKKVDRLDRYLNTINEVRVDLAVEKTRSNADSQVAQFTLHTKKRLLRAEARTDDIYASIDASIDKLHRQIERYKGKRDQRTRGVDPDAAELEEEIPESTIAEVVRVKRFDVVPMDTLEAIEQMELLGHDFFLFYNDDEAAVNLVYRRNDGNYGLLQPQVS
jgi:putative sigma-54 modulation protein